MKETFQVASSQQLTEYVRALRKTRGFTQSDVAKRLGVSKMRIASIEKDVGRISTHRLLVLLNLLGAQLELVTEPRLPDKAPLSNENAPPAEVANPARSTGEW